MIGFPYDTYLPKNILAIFAHMDDETILSLGTLLRFRMSGSNVYILTACMNGRRDSASTNPNAVNQEKRKEVYKTILDECGLESVQNNLDLYDLDLINNQTNTNRLTNLIQSTINENKPNLIITHSNKDLHEDHRTVFKCVLKAIRPHLMNDYLNSVWTTVSQTHLYTFSTYGNFSPVKFVDISEQSNVKNTMLMRYSNIGELTNDEHDIRSAIYNKKWMVYNSLVFDKKCEPYEVLFDIM